MINVNHCASCETYFIGYHEYAHYRRLHGAVLGNYRFSSGEASRGDGFEALADESVLMMCGYSVGREAGLSARERRLILANVMDRGICDKARVMEYLRFFIGSRSGSPGMEAARSKWKSDLDWVRDYRIDMQRRFAVASVKRSR